ncbi:MAG TPA: hypothetical protein VMH27_17350 [Puia sp.]|nr:hypothetical protein [Puia sp.]
MTSHRLLLPLQLIALCIATAFSIGACQKESLTTASVGTGTSPTGNLPNSNPPVIHWVYNGTIPMGNPASLGREQAYGYSINGLGYICGGFFDMPGDGNLYYAKDNWEYNPTAQAWTQKADFPGEWTWGGATFVINSNAYVVAGNDNTTWQYNQTSNTWAQKANYPHWRANATGMSIGGAGYVGCGDDGAGPGTNNFTKSWFMYVPYFDTWTRIADFPGHGRENAFSFVIGNNGYVGSGDSIDFSTTNYFRDFWKYNAATNTWTKEAEFPGKGRGKCVGLNGTTTGVVTTGLNQVGVFPNETSTLLSDTWQYTPGSNSWTQLANFAGGARAWASGFSIGNTIYVAGGNSVDVASNAGAKKDLYSMTLQ